MTEVLSAIKGLVPSGGTVTAVVFGLVLILDLVASIASTVAAVVGGEAPRRIGYASPMGAMFGGVIWLLAAVPHALITALCVGALLSLVGLG